MLLQFQELGERRGTEYGKYDWNPTSDWFGPIQSSLGGEKEAFKGFLTRSIGGFPGDYGGTVMKDLYDSTLRPGSDLVQVMNRGDIAFG